MSRGSSPPVVHRYAVRCTWSGTTALGYDAYDRTHRADAQPAHQGLTLSSDPAFLGDASLLNPEQLLVMAASSCQLLSFLAVAARARVDVRRYEDDAEGVMPESVSPMHITRIVLRPRIDVATGPTVDQVLRLCGIAHQECFIASSLRTEIALEPEVSIVD